MNFAAQFFYYTFQSDGTPWKANSGGSEEYDPFWQRWDTSSPGSFPRVPPSGPSEDTSVNPSNPPLLLCPPPPVLRVPHPPLHPPSPSPPTAQPSPPAGVIDCAPNPPEQLPPSPPPPALQSLVDLILCLALSFIFLRCCSTEERTAGKRKYSCLPDGRGRKDSSVMNGCLARRTTPIHPARLKDFGEDEEMNGDVRIWESRSAGQPELQLMATPQPGKRRGSEVNAPPKSETQPITPPECPSEQHLRFKDISAAAFKIQSGLQRTPCTYSRLSKHCGMEIFLKKEHLHYTGSVKERGVLYLLSTLKQEQQRKGVIVATDNNFSMAVSYHAANLRIPAFVIMPAGSAPARLRVYRDYGAMAISYGSTTLHARNHARHLAKQNDYLYLEEDDSAVYLAGLGTVGLEVCDQVPRLDAVILPAGGNCSLLAAASVALKHINPGISVIGVELEDYPILQTSFKNDFPVKELHTAPNRKLYGDLVDPPLGGQAFQLAKKHVDKVISMRAEEALVAMLRFQEYERSTVDTEGAIGLAAILSGKLPELKGKRVCVVVSSANMELALVRRCLERALVLDEQVVRFTVELGDLPGETAHLLELLAREDVRLLSVNHRRHTDRSDLFKAQVECVVEMRDKMRSSKLRSVLSDRYPSLRWLDH